MNTPTPAAGGETRPERSALAHPDSGAVRLVAVRDEPLSVDEVTNAVSAPGVGGIVTFTGVVRDTDGGRDVTALEYSAHPTASTVLAQVAAQVALGDGVIAVAATHRVGDLRVGDLAVVLAVGAAHRGAAFAAARTFIDTLKSRVPIWKHQLFGDGADEWVGTP